jgi:hypothetical protein
MIEAPGPSLSPRLGPFFGDCHSWKTIENWLWCFTRAAVSQHIQLMVSIITRKLSGRFNLSRVSEADKMIEMLNVMKVFLKAE